MFENNNIAAEAERNDKTRVELEQEQAEFVNELMNEFGSEEYIRQQQEKAASILGVNPNSILVKKDVMATRLSQEGVIVKPHIGRVRFEQKLSERDLGLKPSNEDHKKFFDEYVALGSKYLISREYLNRANRLDGKARRIVEKYGLQTHWGMFVPYGNMARLKAEIDEVWKEYLLIRDDIVANYDSIRNDTIKAYEAAGEQAYMMLSMADIPDSPSLNDFVNRFISLAMISFPKKEVIYDSYYINLDVSFIPLTSFMAEQKVRAELIDQRRELYIRQLQNLEAETDLRNMELQTELQSKIAEEVFKRQAIEEVHKEAIETYKNQVQDFLGDVIGQVYAMVYDAVTEVSKKVEMEGSLSSGDSRMIATMIKKVERLNFTDNQDVKDFLGQLKNMLDYPSTKRDKASIMETLDYITAESRQKLILLGCEQRTIRDERASKPKVTLTLEIEAPSNNERKERRDDDNFFTPSLFSPEVYEERINLRVS